MTHLCVYHQSNRLQPIRLLNHQADIARELEELGAGYQCWDATVPVTAVSSENEIVAACQAGLGLLEPNAIVYTEAFALDEQSSAEQHAVVRKQLAREQVSSQPQSWLVAAGRGMLCLHHEDHVYALVCERGDLLSIPAGIAYWFDAGEQPRFVALRVSAEPLAGEVVYTDENAAASYPPLTD